MEKAKEIIAKFVEPNGDGRSHAQLFS